MYHLVAKNSSKLYALYSTLCLGLGFMVYVCVCACSLRHDLILHYSRTDELQDGGMNLITYAPVAYPVIVWQVHTAFISKRCPPQLQLQLQLRPTQCTHLVVILQVAFALAVKFLFFR